LNQNLTIKVAFLSYWFCGGSMVLKKVAMTKKKNESKNPDFKNPL